jgi:uncharacterized protein (TIGR03435 family)
MLQNLLIDRFRMTLHMETRDVPGFALAVSKNGPRFQESAPGAPPYFKVNSGHPMRFAARQYSMERFAAFIRNMKDAPVVDQTGLKGAYDIKFSWDERDGPSLVTVLAELGLRLESRRVPASFVMIESTSIPVEN